MGITAIVENNAVKLPAGVDLPDGTHVHLDIAPAHPTDWPANYFERTAGILAGEQLERAPQGDTQVREVW